MKHYIGLDAHSSTSTYVVLTEGGELVTKGEVRTSETHLVKFLRTLPGSKHLTFEECQLAQWLYGLLRGEVDELVVCHPGYIRKRSGAKTDALDAEHLAHELRRGHLVSVFHEQSPLMDLRALVRGYLRVVADLVRLKNRYKAAYIQWGQSWRGQRLYANPALLERLSHTPTRFVAQHLFDRIQEVEKIKKAYQAEFRKLKQRSWMIRYLIELPGIEVVRSCIIASLITSPHRFANKHRFWAYCMLVRHPKISAGKQFGQQIAQGRRELKAVWIGAARPA